MNVGDLVEHHVWDNDVYVITSVRKRDPSTGVYGIELQFVFHKDESMISSKSTPSYRYLMGKRYVVERIFNLEWRNVCPS